MSGKTRKPYNPTVDNLKKTVKKTSAKSTEKPIAKLHKQGFYEVKSKIGRVRQGANHLAIIVKELKQGDLVKVVQMGEEWALTDEGYISVHALNLRE